MESIFILQHVRNKRYCTGLRGKQVCSLKGLGVEAEDVVDYDDAGFGRCVAGDVLISSQVRYSDLVREEATTTELPTGIKIGNLYYRDLLVCPDRGTSTATLSSRHDECMYRQTSGNQDNNFEKPEEGPSTEFYTFLFT